MSTKTMRPPPRRVLTASTSTVHPNSDIAKIRTSGFSNISHKRKERDDSFVFNGIISKPPSPSTMIPPGTPAMSKPNAPSRVGSKPGTANAIMGSESGPPMPTNCSNQMLVAGYLAHEFLSNGTLFGHVWDPTRREGNGSGSFHASVSSDGKSQTPGGGGEGDKAKPEEHQRRKEEEVEDGNDRYTEVSSLLKLGGAHLPGIINPSQLARFLQL